MSKDPQARGLYAAQDVMLARHPELKLGTVDDVVDCVNAITETHWFRERWGQAHVNVYDGRGALHGRSRSDTYGGPGAGGVLVADISLPKNVRDVLSVMEEIAHTCHVRMADCLEHQHHGPELVGILLVLYRRHLGRRRMREFKVELVARGVEWKVYKRKAKPVV